MHRALTVVAGALLLGSVDFTPGRGDTSTLNGPVTVHGPVTMTSGPMMIDGGVAASEVSANELSAVAADIDTLTVDTLNASGATVGPVVALAGPVTVTGTSAFSTPPTGIVRKGTLTRGATLALSVGCASLGTVNVPGVTDESACAVTKRPTAVTFGAVLDCYVTSANTVTVRACATVALLVAPAGDYGVNLVGE